MTIHVKAEQQNSLVNDQFVEALHESPEEVGLDAPAWSVPLARHYLAEEFDVEYCERHVRRLMSEAGLSWKTARPEYYKSDERAQEAWQEGFKKSATTWTTNTRS
ncbi:winged helix-turn-helix domain-containing protein [Haloarcula argentinensis]|uniref:winged helix-turn-helix domain-containing protein n=1 Tax=Haloarcula argentinensis TaxID=43776 RepID=UPI0032171A31